MFLRLALVVPAIGEIAVEFVEGYQACARHAQSFEISLGQISDIEPQPLRLAAVFDHELQQDQSFTRIAECVPGSKWMCSFWSGSMNQKLLKPVEWVRHMRGVIFSQRGSSARSL